jgi:transposase-like protein
MKTAVIILGVAVLIIAVDFGYENLRAWLKNRAAYRLLFDSLAPFSEKLSSSKLLVRLKLLTKEWCPYCSSPYMRRSHRYFFEKPLSIFGLWPYRCQHCKARFLKMLGRHFDNTDHKQAGET